MRQRDSKLWSIDILELEPLVFALTMIVGATCYFYWPYEPGFEWILSVVLVVAIAALIALRVSRSLLLNLIVIAAASGCLAFGAASVKAHSVEAPKVLSTTEPVLVEGWVTQFQPGANGTRLTLNVHAIQGIGQQQTPHAVRLTHRLDTRISPGRFVRCWAVLRPPPQRVFDEDYDFERQAYFQKLGGVGYVMGRCRGGVLGAPEGMVAAASMRVNAYRHQMARYVYNAAGETSGGFAAAVVTGDRSFLSSEVEEDLRGSGLAHLLAISGLHMGLLGGVIYFIVFRLVVLIEPLVLRVPAQKIAAVFALAASIAYLILSGASVPTQRAFIMSAVVFSAVLIDRSALSFRSFAIALVVTILLQPESVLTPGFQMSFAASGALIATYEAWTRKRLAAPRPMGRIQYALASLSVTSIVATAATAPFAIFHFNRVSSLSVITNLCAMPVVTFVSAPLAALAFIAVPFGFSETVLGWFGQSLEIIQSIAAYFEDRSNNVGETWRQMPQVSLGFFALAIAFAIIFRGSMRWLCGLLAVAPAVFLWINAPVLLVHGSASGELFINLGKSGETVRLTVQEGDGLPPMRFSDLPATVCDQAFCEIKAEWGYVELIKSPEDEPLINIHHSTHPLISFTWSQVNKSEGMSVFEEKGMPHIRRSVCVSRLWHTCPEET